MPVGEAARRLVGRKPTPLPVPVNGVQNGKGPYRIADGIPDIGMANHIITAGIEIIHLLATDGFTMGSTKYPDERPVRRVALSAFGLSKDPITEAQYKAYLKDTGKEVPSENLDSDKANHPVVNVSWEDAVKFCIWLNQKESREEVYTIEEKDGKTTVTWHQERKGFRLPTEAEWEYAARGNEGREYPWGNEWDKSKVTFDTNGTEPVDAHPEGATPREGIRGLAGNVWEWCWDWYAGEYNKNDVNDPIGPASGNYRVLRGGSWDSPYPVTLRAAYRNGYHPAFRYYSRGFRVAKDYSSYFFPPQNPI